jgi:hypothetical protein
VKRNGQLLGVNLEKLERQVENARDELVNR